MKKTKVQTVVRDEKKKKEKEGDDFRLQNSINHVCAASLAVWKNDTLIMKVIHPGPPPFFFSCVNICLSVSYCKL